MKNFDKTFSRNQGDDSKKRSFKKQGPGKRQFGNRDKERPQMHEAVCSDCGKKCEVPFRPTGDKPVYCTQCFSSHRGSPTPGGSGRRGYERPRFQDKRVFDAICDKCEKRFELPFKPTGDKPVYCNECFDRGGDSSNKNRNQAINQYQEQFSVLNAKLDRIIEALTPVLPAKKKKKETIVKKKKEVVKKKKAKK